MSADQLLDLRAVLVEAVTAIIDTANNLAPGTKVSTSLRVFNTETITVIIEKANKL